MNSQQLFERCIAQLKQQASDVFEAIEQYISEFAFEIVNEKQVIIWYSNSFILGYVRMGKFQELIRTELNNPNIEVKLVMGARQAEDSRKTLSARSDSFQEDKPKTSDQQQSTTNYNAAQEVDISEVKFINESTNLKEDYAFDNFVEGKSNEIGLNAAKSVVQNAGDKNCNPFFLYGGTGLGKTHLMHAIGNEFLKRNPNKKVKYIETNRYVSEYINAIKSNKFEQFRKIYDEVDLLLMDDIQMFAGKEGSQKQFFETFNTLFESKKQIVISSDCYHKELTVDDRIKSRLAWGLALPIEPPDLETRVAILKSKADDNEIELSDEVAFFIADRLKTNVRELEGIVKRMKAFKSLQKVDINNVEFIREHFADVLTSHSKITTIENIQRTVAEYFRINLSDMLSKNRSRSLARPRQIAMTLSKELTNHSYPEIGNAFGGKDHTTIIHAEKTIKRLKIEDKDLAEDYRNIHNTLMA